MPDKKTAKKSSSYSVKVMTLLEAASWPLLLLPVLTDYMETGRLPSTVTDYYTELVVGSLILLFILLLRHLRLRVEYYEAMRDDMLHSLVHDLKNPLSSIMAAMEIMDAQPMDTESKSVIGMARNSCSNQLELIENMLDAANMESGRLKLRLESVDTRALLDSALEPLLPSLKVKNLSVLVECEPGAERICCDRAFIFRALTNLVTNAVKYTPPDGQVLLLARTVGGFIVMSVHDSGPGLPPEKTAGLFSKFFRVEGRDQSRKRGSGVGLYFCRIVARQHGGFTAVGGSDRLGGARFDITVPAQL